MSKLIVALDFDNKDAALQLINQLNPLQCGLKIGSEMFTLFGPDFVRLLVDKKFNVLLDLKFYDIPQTVAKACIAGAKLGVWMMTVHASGGVAMMTAAMNALNTQSNSRPLLVAVTVLTSVASVDVELAAQVLCLAQQAQNAGVDGVVSSALEVPMIKSACGQQFLTVTPGIRLLSNDNDDQMRVVTPAQAIKAGSDYLVIGRPITQANNPSDIIRQLL